MKKFIEALLVCYNYGDFLFYTLGQTSKLMDKVVVVTAEDDKETIDICSNYKNVNCVCTDNFWKHENKKFDKEAGMNYGFKFLDKKDWICNLDADTYLPDDLRDILENKDLRKDCLYGIPRRICQDKQLFIQDRDYKSHQPTWRKTRFPAGYFQLYHSSTQNMVENLFIENQEIKRDTDNPDFLFAYQFDYWSIIKNIEVIHLGEFGPCNWDGRTSKRW